MVIDAKAGADANANANVDAAEERPEAQLDGAMSRSDAHDAPDAPSPDAASGLERPAVDAPCAGCECTGCPQGMACSARKCICDPALPTGWPDAIAPWLANPVIAPTPSSPTEGADNIYAPEIHPHKDALVMWYGAQGSDGHDQIFLAWSRDGATWRKYPRDDDPQPVLRGGGSNHVNDPSVVRVGGVWRMYYTDAATAERDRIWLAESSSPIGFRKVGQALGPGPRGSWEEEKVGRPALLHEGGVYKMWYDGQVNGLRHVGYATSTDGLTFTRHPGNPVFRNAGAVYVKKIGGVYVMAREGRDGTYWATSADGLCWTDRGRMFGLSGRAFDRYGQVTPFLHVDGSSRLRAVWFGGASVTTWNRNRIAVAFSAGLTPPPGGGCAQCAPAGLSCPSACQRAGGGTSGSCANPGSGSAGACCSCFPEGCEACTGSARDCQAACVGAGAAGGWCQFPGSTAPSACCTCL